jgi:hypothetical protein
MFNVDLFEFNKTNRFNISVFYFLYRPAVDSANGNSSCDKLIIIYFLKGAYILLYITLYFCQKAFSFIFGNKRNTPKLSGIRFKPSKDKGIYASTNRSFTALKYKRYTGSADCSVGKIGSHLLITK